MGVREDWSWQGHLERVADDLHAPNERDRLGDDHVGG